MIDKETSVHYKDLNVFEDLADDGDESDYGPLQNDRPLYSSDCEAFYVYNSPPRLLTFTHKLRNKGLTTPLPALNSYLHLDNPCLPLTAIKQSAHVKKDQPCLVVRIFNPLEETQEGLLRFGFSAKKLEKCNMVEHPVEKGEIKFNSGTKRAKVRLAPHEILTLKVTRAQ